jgi:hypothetical protein
MKTVLLALSEYQGLPGREQVKLPQHSTSKPLGSCGGRGGGVPPPLGRRPESRQCVPRTPHHHGRAAKSAA